MGLDITGLGSAADFATGIMDRFFPKKMDEKEATMIRVGITEAIENREAKVIDNKKEVMVAELNQDDNYTKRARPTIVYVGLAVIVLNNAILPWLGWALLTFTESKAILPIVELPSEFWLTWGGVCSVWVWGRSKEKTGFKDKLISKIVGR